MDIERRTDGDVLIVSVKRARIDAEVAHDFRDDLARVVSEGHKRFVLDLSATEFVDSSGLGAMVAALRSIGLNGEIVISGARKTVRTLFKMTRMDKVFKMTETDAQAVELLS